MLGSNHTLSHPHVIAPDGTNEITNEQDVGHASMHNWHSDTTMECSHGQDTQGEIMSQFVTVARVEDVEPGTARQVWVGDVPVAICSLDGEFHAISDICTHEEFYLSGGV